MLTFTGPSRITQETAGFSKEKGCVSSKHDFLRKSPFFDNDWGND